MEILVLDDSLLWIKQSRILLQDYWVNGFVVPSGGDLLTSNSLHDWMVYLLRRANVLLIDKDLGEGITSTRFICVVRYNFPKLPIVRWTGGYDDKPYMKYLGVTSIEKPTRRNEATFVETFTKAVDEQKLILSGPMGIFAVLDETVDPDKYAARRRVKRLTQITEIAQLSTEIIVSPFEGPPWTITGETSGNTKHELGHCICDGDLTAEDIRPHLSALQAVIAKFEAAGEIDERFKTCAEFIKVGNLEELELVRRCY